MSQTVEVRFKGTRKGYFAWADESDPIRVKDVVIVEVAAGPRRWAILQLRSAAAVPAAR